MRFILIFVVLSAFVPNAASGQSIEDRIVDNHYAYVPSGAGPFPTLIAIPGCSGISADDPAFENSNPDLQEDDLLFRRHYRTMASKFRDQGFAVYLIDVHKAESVLTACAGEIQSEKLAEYISAATAWVAEQPRVEESKIHLIGWSMGGRGVLEWLHGPRKSAKNLKSAIAVYPGCDEASDLTIQIPILMLLGGADDIAEPAICEELVQSAVVKDQIVLKVYPGARHGFDIEDAPPLVDIGGGMTVGYQRSASEASWNEILSFLGRGE
jgi:dienelactone hydrolase